METPLTGYLETHEVTGCHAKDRYGLYACYERGKSDPKDAFWMNLFADIKKIPLYIPVADFHERILNIFHERQILIAPYNFD
jgi:hypothetical protein